VLSNSEPVSPDWIEPQGDGTEQVMANTDNSERRSLDEIQVPHETTGLASTCAAVLITPVAIHTASTPVIVQASHSASSDPFTTSTNGPNSVTSIFGQANFGFSNTEVMQNGRWSEAELLRLADGVIHKLHIEAIVKQVRTRTRAQCEGQLRERSFSHFLAIHKQNIAGCSGTSAPVASVPANVVLPQLTQPPSKRARTETWPPEKVRMLIAGLYTHGRGNNQKIAADIPGITAVQVNDKIRHMAERGELPDDIPNRKNKSGATSGHWTDAEMNILLTVVNNSSASDYPTIARALAAKGHTRDIPAIERLVTRLVDNHVLEMDNHGKYFFTTDPLRRKPRGSQ
jgi:hypothetical protein